MKQVKRMVAAGCIVMMGAAGQACVGEAAVEVDPSRSPAEGAPVGETENVAEAAEEVVSGVTCLSSAVGAYCLGDTTSGVCPGCAAGVTLLQCPGKNMAPTKATACPSGCRTMPSPQPDYCAVGATEISTLMSAAQTKLGSYGGQCKTWVQNIVSSSLPGVTIPATTASQYDWQASSHTGIRSQWLATSATRRFDLMTVAAHGTWSASFNLTNGEQYQVLVFGAGTLLAEVRNGASSLVGSVPGASTGTLSGTFAGVGSYTLSVKSSSTGSQVFTAVVFSRSQFSAAFQAAQRGDPIQMYGDLGAGDTPHTTLVQNTGNGGTNNWIDSNFCAGNCQIVSQHTVSVDQMARWIARRPQYGFTVYRIQ